jgi:hypothetical protein
MIRALRGDVEKKIGDKDEKKINLGLVVFRVAIAVTVWQSG